jgi:hypothetical protein
VLVGSTGTELLDELAMKAVVSRPPHRAATVGPGMEQAATATSCAPVCRAGHETAVVELIPADHLSR